jgi:hypothetical protein
MPPADCTALSHAVWSGLTRPVGVLTSMLVKTARRWPTMSAVTVIVRQPIRSALPRASPKVTSRPVRGSGRLPTWLRNSRVCGWVPSARRICCWRVVSALATGSCALPCKVDVLRPPDWVPHATGLADCDELFEGLRTLAFGYTLLNSFALQLAQLTIDLLHRPRPG